MKSWLEGFIDKGPQAKDQPMPDLNARFNLPFKHINDKKVGQDFVIKWISYNTYEVIIDPHHSYSSHVITVDAQVARDIIDMKHMPQIGLYRISKEEEQELKQLREEETQWRKNKKLELFRKLPSHLRQEIVDEAILKSIVTNDHLADDFHGFKRIRELEEKEGSYKYATRLTSIAVDQWQFDYKYAIIINTFTLEELSDAHSEASLEDALEN